MYILIACLLNSKYIENLLDDTTYCKLTCEPIMAKVIHHTSTYNKFNLYATISIHPTLQLLKPINPNKFSHDSPLVSNLKNIMMHQCTY